MSEPRIRVFADATGHDDVPCFVWYCNDGLKLGLVCASGETWTIHDAATEGMKHLAEHHAQGYCRPHGVHKSVCGCRVASVDPDAENGPENGSDAIADQCGCTPRDPHSIHDTHDNPLQTTHNESREGC